MELAKITQFQNFYNENLLSKKSLLKDNPTLNYSGDGSIALSDENSYTSKGKSVYLHNPYPTTLPINSLFDFGDALIFTATKAGSYMFQFSMMNQTTYGEPLDVELILKVYINSNLEHTFNSTFDFFTLFQNDSLYTFAQSFNLIEGDIVDFAFEVNSDYPGNPAPTLQLYFSGFKCEFNNKGITDNPTPYSLPNQKLLNWQQRVDTTNTQNILANTETNFGFVGTSESNDNTTLITTTGLITPIYQNDVVSIDYYFDFVTTTSTDKFVDVFFKVNSIIYRAETFILTKAIGETEFVSGSFKLPVGADFKQYGAQIVIKSSEAITIENRYINAIETTNI